MTASDSGEADASDAPESAAAETDPVEAGTPEPGEAGAVAAGTDDERTLRTRVETARDRVRSDPRDHAVALAIATLLGLGLAWIHWLGLVAGGALVGLTAPRLPRAPLYAVGFGAVVLLVFAVTVWSSLSLVVAMEPIVYLTAGSAIGLPLLGSLARGVV